MPSAISTTAPLPSTQKALVQDAAGKPKVVSNIRLPELSPGDILVETRYVALNPCDYKMPSAFPTEGAVIGNDFVGNVVRVHEQTSTNIRIGDTVCGLVHGSNPADRSNGAFAQYIRAPANLVLRVPESLKIEQAVALGSALTTSCVALWEGGLGLDVSPDKPAKEPFPVLVYGASTATGTMALQLLRLSGVQPIAVCSPRNFDLVSNYGAAIVLDYADPETASRIKKVTNGELEYALDIITDPDSVACCYASLSRFGGQYTCLEYCPKELQKRQTVKANFPLALEVFGKEIKLSRGYERAASKTQNTAAVRWFAVFQRLLDEGKLKAHPIKMLPSGLDEIVPSIEELKSGSVSGYKLVVPLR